MFSITRSFLAVAFRSFTFALWTFLAAFSTSYAQGVARKLADAIDVELQKGNWEEAEKDIDRFFNLYGDRDLAKIPDFYQQMFFKRGWCALKLKKWSTAIASFKTSYNSYRNLKTNPYRNLALRGWAEAAFESGDAQTAAKIYHRYLFLHGTRS